MVENVNRAIFPSKACLCLCQALLELGSAVLAVRVKKGVWRAPRSPARARAVLVNCLAFPGAAAPLCSVREALGDTAGCEV